jgi:hypothetical protein
MLGGAVMSKVIMQLTLNPENADLTRVRRELSLAEDEIDAEFGVREISSSDNLYVVLVDSEVVTKIKDREGVSGPFSNMPIRPASGGAGLGMSQGLWRPKNPG